MREQGYKKSDVWLDQAEYVIILAAARQAGMGVARFLRLAAIDWTKTFAHPGRPWVPPIGLHGRHPAYHERGPSSSSDHKSNPTADG
jgi:hypothetical protein